jgi:tetratricopeptide (TPR) repeat protein
MPSGKAMSRKLNKKAGPGKAVAMRLASSAPSSGRRAWIFGLVLVAAVVAAYQPAWRAGFIWDDDSWTTGISGLLHDFSGLRTMWFQPLALQQYYPVTGASFWLDYQLWSFWPPPYHVENILLHAFAALLFWKLLQKLEVPGAWLAAGIFALHPVMVESVAWVTERKNVLSMIFFLGALLAYGRFNSFWKNEINSPRRRGAYPLAFLLFLLALLAKTATLSFPAVILLIGWWKNGRLPWRRDILPTLPFFGLAIGLSLLTAWLEKNHVGAAGSDFAMTFPERCLVAGRAPWFYLGKLFWPENLCFIYPRWQPDAGSWWLWLFPIAALAALAVPWLGRKKIGRGPATAACFFIGTLFPVLGFMNAYGMRYSFVWDHWVYLSSLGIFAGVAATAANLAGHFKKPAALFGFAAVLLPLLAILTWRQCGMYADIETLWRTALARNPGSSMVHYNLGTLFVKQGRLVEATSQFQDAIRLTPGYADEHNNLGNVLVKQGRLDEAIGQYREAIRLQPDSAEAHNNLGSVFVKQGQLDEAISHFQDAIRLQPGFAEAHYNLGTALDQQGQFDGAISQFQEAIRLQPDSAEIHYNLGSVLIKQSRLDEAIRQLQDAIRLKSDYAEAHNNLGTALGMNGRLDEAISQYQEAIRLQPDYTEARNNLARVLEIKNTPAGR